MGIARQIGQHGLRPAERALGIDDPLGSAQRCQIRREGLRIGESGVIAEELQVAELVCGKESLQKQPSEQAREHAHRQEEAGPARHPTLAVERDAAARHDHMDMRMMGERRAPGMENRGDADAGAEVLGVGRDNDQGLGRGLEQQVVDDGLVLIGDIGDGRRQCEHDMMVRHRQQIGLARRQPFLCHSPLALRAVPVAARVVRDLGVRALLAARDMSAERRRAAVLDRRHHLQLAEADMTSIGPTPCRAVAAEDVRDLQRWTRHDARQAGGSTPSLSLLVIRSSGLMISRMVLVATRA